MTTTPAKTDLEIQIELERKELESVPKIPVSEFRPRETGSAGRCGWCGRIAQHLVPVHDLGPHGELINERYKGECCGGRHG